jgi:uncharacterized protein (TIGR03437 family)
MDLRGQNPDLNSELFRYETKSRQLEQLTFSVDSKGISTPKLSGDGLKIAYISGGKEDLQSLVLFDVRSRSAQVLAGNVKGLTMPRGNAISDDARRVVYALETVENQSELYMWDQSIGSSIQITSLGARDDDVPLEPTISGDGNRITFATRRSVTGENGDKSVELYLYDIPSARFTKLTDAPAKATAEVISSLNYDGSLVVFNFPRILSGQISNNELANNSEIYILAVSARPLHGDLQVRNAASPVHETNNPGAVAPESIAIAQGMGLAFRSVQAQRLDSGAFPTSIEGTTVAVNGQPAQLLHVSSDLVAFVVPATTLLGVAQVEVRNADGYSSIGSIEIHQAAPGVFTINGSGTGAAVALNADTLQADGFDPTNNNLRLTIFATGTRNSRAVAATFEGHDLIVEGVYPSTDLPGLDEVHVLVPKYLAGVGQGLFSIDSEGRTSNPTLIKLAGSSLRDIVINEVLVDPPDGIGGDANRDGRRDSANDEFVELINSTTRDLDIGGYEIFTRAGNSNAETLRHRFPEPTIVFAGTALVVFGGGSPAAESSSFGKAQVFRASSGGLSLTNSAGSLTIKSGHGEVVSFISYGPSVGLRADLNQSVSRMPDVTGDFQQHEVASGGQRLFSPGTTVSGDAFLPNPAVEKVLVSPVTAVIKIGQDQQFDARAIDLHGNEISEVIFSWASSDPNVATIDPSGRAVSVGPGKTNISAAARGVSSAPVDLTVIAPKPSPSPVPSPTVTPTPSPSPTISPSPSPAPTPSPSPTPQSSPRVLISQIYGGGGNSAATYRNDFIEIFNAGDSSMTLTGWSVQYASATGVSWSVTTLSSITLLPGQYYLIQQASAGVTGSSLPAPDVAGTIAMAATAGKVALVNSTSPLTGACPITQAVDLVGYGSTANCFTGAGATPPPSNTNSVMRNNNGCSDTRNNSVDFTTAAPVPRNSLTPVNECARRAGAVNHSTLTQPVASQPLLSEVDSACPSPHQPLDSVPCRSRKPSLHYTNTLALTIFAKASVRLFRRYLQARMSWW